MLSLRIWIATFECKTKFFRTSVGNIKYDFNWASYFASKILVVFKFVRKNYEGKKFSEYKWKLCQDILPGVSNGTKFANVNVRWGTVISYTFFSYNFAQMFLQLSKILNFSPCTFYIFSTEYIKNFWKCFRIVLV